MEYFYEFIPMKTYGSKDEKIVSHLGEVEKDVNYAILITTNAGLMEV